MFYVVAYDIADDKRRKKISDILEGYGVRVNYSVFELEIDKKTLEGLKDELLTQVNLKEDSIRFYHLCKNCAGKSFELCKRGDVFEIIGGFF